jgi:hypothetical protein
MAKTVPCGSKCEKLKVSIARPAMPVPQALPTPAPLTEHQLAAIASAARRVATRDRDAFVAGIVA